MSELDFKAIVNKIKNSNMHIYGIEDSEAYHIYNASLIAADVASQRSGIKIAEVERNKIDAFRRLKKAAEKVDNI